MIMANGNSRQMLTTISEGRTVLTLSMKFGGRSSRPSCDEDHANDAEVRVVDPFPDIGSGNHPDHPRNDKDGAQHAAPTKSRCRASASGKAQDEGDDGRGQRPDHRVERDAPEHVADEDGRVVVEPDEALVLQLQPGGVLKKTVRSCSRSDRR